MSVLASVSFGDVLLTVLEIAVLACWIWVAVSVLIDIFRSDDLTSAAKAGWVFAVVLIPLVGVLLYIIVRGDKMRYHEIGSERQLENLRDRGVLTDEEYGRATSRQPKRSKPARSDDVQALEDLRDHGVLTEEEFARAKEKANA